MSLPSTSHITQESVKSYRRLPLSRPMCELNALVLMAIDRRVALLAAASSDKFEPETCGACEGTGYTLVPLDEFDHCGSADDEHNVQEPPSSLASTRANSPDLSLKFTAEMASILGLCRAEADVPSDVTPPNSVAAPVDDDSSSPGPAPTTDPAILVAGSSAGVAIGAAVTTPPVTAAPVTAAVSTSSGQALPPPTAAPAGQGLPVITPNVPGGPALAPLPPASTVIPGLNPLGPNHPVPLPVDAIFAEPNQARYYTVTKGIRVGVFAGWQNTSPYVTGVSGAVYARCANLHIAFAAYSEAFGRGAVRYI